MSTADAHVNTSGITTASPDSASEEGARQRVGEFVRQWELQMRLHGDRDGRIYSVHFDAKTDGASLTVADLTTLLGVAAAQPRIAAETLRDAASDQDKAGDYQTWTGRVSDWLRARADEIEGQS